MKKILVLIYLCILVYTSYGQTTSLYYFDPKLINPAFAGVVDEQNYQLQYDGAAMNSKYNGDIYDLYTAYSNKLKAINSGIGAVVGYESFGTLKNFDARILYNYQVKISAKSLLSFGTNFRYINIKFEDIEYHSLDPNDPKVFEYKPINHIYSGFGLVYNYERFNIGINAKNALLLYTDNSTDDWSTHKDYSLFTSYQIKLGPSLKLTPSVYIISDFKGSNKTNLNVLTEWRFLMVGFSAGANNYQNYSRYSAGVTIAKKIQLITSIYNSLQYKLEGAFTHLDMMLRVKIANKQVAAN